MLVPPFLLVQSNAELLTRTFLLGVIWSVFLSLLFYSFFYRRDKTHQWATIALASATGAYTCTWLNTVLSISLFTSSLTTFFLCCEGVLVLSVLGFIHVQFPQSNPQYFRLVFKLGCLLIPFAILVGVVQSPSWMALFKLGRIVIMANIIWVCYEAMRRKQAGGMTVFIATLLVITGELYHLYLFQQLTVFRPLLATPVWILVSSVSTFLVAIMLQLARHNTQTREQLNQKQDELLLLAAQKEQTLAQQNAWLDEQVSQRTAELNEANQAKNRLFSIISHDLRSPVISLKNALLLLQSKRLTQDETNRLTQQLTQSTDRLYINLDNLLAWSLSQMNELRTRPQPVAVYGLADEVLELAEEVARQKGISISNRVDGNLVVLADEHQLKIILRNLVDNAIKFTPAGGTICIHGQNTDDWGVVCVTDNGVGIPAKQLRALLDQPELLAGTNGEKGMGLGLRLCHDLLARNGGQLTISSQPDRGTSAELRLHLITSFLPRYFPVTPFIPTSKILNLSVDV